MVINRENKFLLVDSYKRGWEFPGGFVGNGESIKAAAIREVKEESGINIELTDLLGIEQDIAHSTTVIILSGKPISGKFTISNETREIGYFTFNDALKKFTLDIFKERMIRCLDENQVPFLITR